MFSTQLNETKYTIELKEKNSKIKLTIPEPQFKMRSKNFEVPVFVEFSKEVLLQGERMITLILKDVNNNEIKHEKEVRLVGPLN